MKVEIVTKDGKTEIGHFDALPQPAEITAVMPNFMEWFYGDADNGAVVAWANDGPYILISLPPRTEGDDGLYWDGPYEPAQIAEMVN